MDAQQQEMIAGFCGVTGATTSTAQTALDAANWNLEEAVGLYFAAQGGEEDENDDNGDDDETPLQASSSSSGPKPAQSSAQPGSSRQTQRPKQMTINDLKKGDDDGGDSDDDRKRDLFAGGGKSGLAVQDPTQGGSGPSDHFRNIMKQAMQNRDRPAAEDGEEDEPEERSSNFTGRAQTLGGDDAESQVIEDPLAAARDRQQALPRVTRTLHLWADGISIDDGPLFRFDDPANQNMMAEINRGRAPLALLDVQQGQQVDLNLVPHKDENYVQPKKQYKAFSGQGQRLGAPVPGSAPAPAASSSSAAAPTDVQTPANSTPRANVDESQPTLQLQIRLGDGSRLQSRFNTSHTVGDVYDFINNASPASTARSYVLMTTFPSKELNDKQQVLGDMSDFKRGGVMVQKWT